LGAEPIDITSDDDDGFRTLLATAVAQQQVDLSVEGVLKDSTLIEIAAAAGIQVSNYTLSIPGIGSITGDFAFTGLELGANYNEAVTFSATIMSTGQFTFAPPTT